MLSSRKQAILKTIIEQYVVQAVPVPSQQIAKEFESAISSATVRNEMAYLEQEGYIMRPHTSAGSVPSDKGYRYYVETLDGTSMPISERVLINHLFHQVEDEVENWLSLAVTTLAQMTRTVALVSMPKTNYSRFKHIELVSLQDLLVLVVFVMYGARVKQQLISLTDPIDQTDLNKITNKLNDVYFGMNREQISSYNTDLSILEKSIRDYLLRIMQIEDEPDSEEAYLEGWHFLLHQPEFEQTNRIVGLMELAEHRNLLRTILPMQMPSQGIKVVIGKENEVQTIQDYSIIIGRYGLEGEAVGTVGVVGPTRMQYARNLSVVSYLISILNDLVSDLYDKKSTTTTTKVSIS